jgi:hypothetical protein
MVPELLVEEMSVDLQLTDEPPSVVEKQVKEREFGKSVSPIPKPLCVIVFQHVPYFLN